MSNKLTVQTKTRELVKSHGLNTGGDVFDTLDEKIKTIIADAAQRAKDNGRKTLMGKDL